MGRETVLLKTGIGKGSPFIPVLTLLNFFPCLRTGQSFHRKHVLPATFPIITPQQGNVKTTILFPDLNDDITSEDILNTCVPFEDIKGFKRDLKKTNFLILIITNLI